MIPSADPVLANVVYPLLLVLALLLPFEATKPLFFVGPFGITTVELPLYAVVAVSLAGRDAWRKSAWTSVHWAATLWAAAHLASAAVAEGDRALAFRFALRMCAGAALVFPVAAASRGPGRPLRVLQALVAGAVLSAATAVAESVFPGVAAWLAAFKTTTAHVGDVIRAGGPFQYPNPAALYWGAALPALLVTFGWPERGRVNPVRWSTITGGVILVAAIVASGSRGAVVVTAIVLVSLAALAPVGLRPTALGALGLLGAAAFLGALLRPALIVRDSGPLAEAPWFAGQFEPLGPVPPMAAGQNAAVRVRARNVGSLAWEVSAPMPMAVSAQWLDPEGRIAHEEPATLLPISLPPGATTVVEIRVTAPEQPGRYALRFQLVGNNTSFEGPPAGRVDLPVVVTGMRVTPARVWPAPRSTQRQVTRPELWRAGWSMWRTRPFFGVGPDGFRQLYGPYLGPRALDDRVNANNLYVETLADLGLAGALALALVFATLARAFSIAWTRAQERELILASAAALFAFALHGLVDSVLAFTPLHGLFWVHAGLLARHGAAGQGTPAEPARSGESGALRDRRRLGPVGFGS
jgi:hypothetical protein